MKLEYIRILVVLNITEKIRDRGRFKKIIYILKQQGAPFDEEFTYINLYGMHSAKLMMELDYLVDNDIVTETKIDHCFEYKYEKEILMSWNEQEKKLVLIEPKIGIDKLIKDSIINKYKNIIKFLNSKSYLMLELVSTIYYLKDKGYSDNDKLKRKLQVLKPNLSSKIEEAYNIYNQIKGAYYEN